MTYSSSGASTLDVPKNGYITQLDAHLLANVTPAATTVEDTDGLAKLVDSCRISAAGQTYFDAGDGREWLYWGYFRHRGQTRKDSMPAAGGAATNVRASFEIHLGFEAQRTPTAVVTGDGTVVRTQIGGPFDPTVVIPAHRLSNPQIEVKWKTASELGTGYTINSAYMYWTVSEIVLDHEDEKDIWPNGLLVPRVESASEALDTAHSNKQLRHEVPTSLVLYQTLILVLDGSDDRSDTPVTELSVEFPPERETPVDLDWIDALIENRKRCEVASNIAGAYLLEWPNVSGDELGIDLTNRRVGDCEIGLTNAATSSGVARFFHVGYQPEP